MRRQLVSRLALDLCKGFCRHDSLDLLGLLDLLQHACKYACNVCGTRGDWRGGLSARMHVLRVGGGRGDGEGAESYLITMTVHLHA